MNNIICPSDEDLMPLLVEESVDGSVQSHLQDCTACRQRLDLFRSDLNALRAVSIEMPPVSAPPSRPVRIGKYLVVGTLDSGGQADVYRGLHPMLDKELAIKLGRRAVGRLSDHRPLLVAEGKLLAKLDHPGLARIYDLDFHEELPFLAMEYVRGPNLRQYAADVKVTSQKAASIVAEVGRALSVVHRHGIVHQDIKPQNILIDENNRPRLIDFGMARLRHAWDDSGEATTGGTPAFMAPEQARNDETAIGPRSDVFALGGVLYFLLTGQAPFRGENVLETLERAKRCEFDRAALDRPGIPRWLREIGLKAMAAKPGDRYGRVDEMSEQLERYLGRPRRVARFSAGAIAAIVLLGLAVGLGNWHPKPNANQTLQSVEAPAALDVKVFRNGQSYDLAKAIPLNPADDLVQVVAKIPAGHHAVMLHRDGKGKVKPLSVRESPAEGSTRLIYPAEEGKFATFKPGVPGTEMVLVFASEHAESLDTFKLADMTEAMLGDLPRLPPAADPIWFGPNETYRHPTSSFGDAKHSFGDAKADPVAEVEAKLDSLRQRLREDNQHPLSVMRGVAYPR